MEHNQNGVLALIVLFLISTFRQIHNSKTKTCTVIIDMEYFQKQLNMVK